MKEITLIKIFGSLLIFTGIVGAIVHTWALWPQARQEWEQLLDNKPKTMLFSKQTQSKNMEKKFDVGDFVRYTAYPGAKPEYGFVKQIRLDKDGLLANKRCTLSKPRWKAGEERRAEGGGGGCNNR